MIAGEIGKFTSCHDARMLRVLVEGMTIKALQVGYDPTREVVPTPLFNVVGECIVDIIKMGKKDSLLMQNTEALTKFNRLMEA